MNIFSQDIFQKATQVKLSSLEKEGIRARVELFIAQQPVRNALSPRLLLQEESKSYISTFVEIVTLLQALINKLQPMAIALLIALFIGGGTSFAAESALPGDLLYPVKVGLNEEARSFVAVSSEAQAKWDARRAERRLEEAEKLAAEGRLDAEVRAAIESRFESHADAFKEQTKKIDSTQNTNASLEINSDFEASLKAHEQVLARIAGEKANVQGDVESLLIEVRTRLNATTQARSSVEAEVSAEADDAFIASADGKLGAAENKINEVRNFIVRMKASVSAGAYAQAETKLTAAESVVARGKTEIEAHTYGKAFASFQEAIRIAQEAKLLVATEKRINIEIGVPGVATKVEGEAQEKHEQEQETSSISGTSSIEVKSETKVKSETDPVEAEGSGKIKIDIGL